MLFAASLIDGAFEAFCVALSRQDLFAQPMAERLGIINCRFSEAVQLANLCTMILNSAPAPLILFELLRCDFERFAINSTTVGTADACCGRYASN